MTRDPNLATVRRPRAPLTRPGQNQVAAPKIRTPTASSLFGRKRRAGPRADLRLLRCKGRPTTEISETYKAQGLVSLYVFKEPDEKMAKYAKEKKLDMLYAVDPKGDSWGTFQTKAMPVNFLIAKGGKIVSIATGCEPNGLVANAVSQKAGKLLNTEPVDVKSDKKK